MNSFILIEFDIIPINSIHIPLKCDIMLNNDIIFSNFIDKLYHIEHYITNSIKTWDLSIKLSKKTHNHTILVDNDYHTAEIQMQNLKIDNINIMPLLEYISVYNHNHNGYGDVVNESFTSIMGCNGTAHILFSTPLYYFLLEHKNH